MSMKRVKILQAEMRQQIAARRWQLAARRCRQAIDLTQKALGNKSADLANLYNDLAEIEAGRQDFSRALHEARKAAAVTELMGPGWAGQEASHIRIRTLTMIGDLCLMLGQSGLEQPELEQAVHVAQATFGIDSDESFMAMNNLGIAYKNCGRFRDAIELFEQPLGALNRRGTANTLLLADLFRNLGGTYHACGDYARAEPYARASWQCARDAFGDMHVRTHAESVAYAIVLDAIGSYGEAEQRYRSAIEAFELAYGQRHLTVARAHHSLAAALALRERWQDAYQAYRRALTVKRHLLGGYSPEVAQVRIGLAGVAIELGDRSRARRWLNAAHRVLRPRLVPTHPVLRTLDRYLFHARPLRRRREVA